MLVGLTEHPRADGRKQSKARNLLERLRDRETEILRFTTEAVPFTNNGSEVRHEVARSEWTCRGEGQQMMLAA